MRLILIKLSILSLLFYPSIMLLYWDVYSLKCFFYVILNIIKQWIFFSILVQLINYFKLIYKYDKK